MIFWEIDGPDGVPVHGLEHGRAEVREAGLQYLVASHITTLLIIVLFSLTGSTADNLAFPAGGSLDPRTHRLPLAIFLTALAAFGIKAGIMPLHTWLPAAHANAPSHISALMSGSLLKMGIYGLLRAVSFFRRHRSGGEYSCSAWESFRRLSGFFSPSGSMTSSACWPTTASRTSASSSWVSAWH